MAIRKIAETIADRSKFALVSTGYILKKPKYLIAFLLSLLLFIYFLTFFRDGSSNWQLIWSGLGLDRKLEVLGRVFPAMLDNFSSFYGVTIILLSLLQSVIVAQIIFAWRHREKEQSLNSASTGGVGAILGFVALGCPSCGIGLLTPLLTAIAGASAVALADIIGQIFSILAFALLLFSIIRLGYINYIIISSKNYKEEHAKSH
jgi:hypothetical protein